MQSPRSTPIRYAPAVLGVLTGLIVLVWGVVFWLTIDLRAQARHIDIRPQRQSTIVFDRNDRPAFSFSLEERTSVRLDAMSPWMSKAVVAAEDRRFYRHMGIDLCAVLRAGWVNLRAGRVAQGASSITQQLARTVLHERKRTLHRKLREVIVALELERRFDKNDLLEAYLNTIYFGNGRYGVAAAAEGYFGKSVADLDASEAATLAALIPAPGTLSRQRSARALHARRDRILGRMARAGVLTERDHARATSTPLSARLDPGDTDVASADPETSRWGGYYKEAIRQQLTALVGEDAVLTGGLRVYTTVDPEVQRVAERVVTLQAASIDQKVRRSGRTTGAVQAALVAMDPATGDVRALVGGRDFHRSPFDRARQARRQPGSTFKPLIAAAALESGLYPGTMLKDLEQPVDAREGEWLPGGEHERAQMTLRQALVLSSNRAAVHLLSEVGVARAVSVAHRLGVASELPAVPSLALGTGEVTLVELTSAYAPFANGGLRVGPRLIRRVETRDGDTIYSATAARERVLRSSTALLMTNMLSDVVALGTASAVRRLGFKSAAAGKTGTTDDYADAWFVGYTPELLAGVWVGHDVPQQIIERGFAARVAVPVWTAFMKEVGVTDAQFPRLEGYERVPLCRVSGERATEYCLLPPRELDPPPGIGFVLASTGAIVQPAPLSAPVEDPVFYDVFPAGAAPPPCSVHLPASGGW